MQSRATGDQKIIGLDSKRRACLDPVVTVTVEASQVHALSPDLDEIIDLRFFDNLQDEFEADTGTAREGVHNAWLRDFVVPRAHSILHEAMDSLPCPANHRYRALVNAEGLFEGRLRSNGGLSFLFDDIAESTP